MTLTGPATLAPDQTAAFTAVELFTNGTTQDVTTQAQWQSSSPAAVTVSSTGAVTGHQAGEAQISAHVGILSSTVTVLVLPPGTFRLIGTASEGTFPVSNVAVTVTSGIGTGLSAETDSSGQYRLYGVAGTLQIRATASGFIDATATLTVSANAELDVPLTPANPEPNIAGVYAMTLDADPSCALPSDDFERHYVATITQTSPSFTVALSGATFVTKSGLGSSFSGHILGGQIGFALNGGYYYGVYPDLVESLSGGQILVVDGAGLLMPSGVNLVATFPGSIIVGQATPWTNNWVAASCTSPHQHLTLAPQTTAARRIKR